MKKISFLLLFLLFASTLAFAEPAATSGPFCPVSGDKAKSKFSYEYKGKTYHFCCARCIKDFKKDPEGFLSGKLKAPNMMKS